VRSMLRLEWEQGWRSYRLTSLLIVAVFFALLDPPSVKYMPQLLEQLGGGFQIIAPEPTPAMSYINYLGDLSQLGALVAIIIAMGAVAQERDRGVTGWILATPVRRAQYLGAKVIVLLAGIAGAAAAGSALCYAYTGTLIGWPDPVGAAAAALDVGVYVLFVGQATLAASSLFRSQYAAGGMGIGVMFGTWLLGVLLGRTAIGSYLPNHLTSDLEVVLTLNLTPFAYWTPILGTLLITALITWYAIVRFQYADF